MSEHEEAPERELDEMQAHADSLGDQIGDAREDWESKKADAAVPGAGGDPLAAHSDDEDGDGEGLSADDPLDVQDPENEDL